MQNSPKTKIQKAFTMRKRIKQKTSVSFTYLSYIKTIPINMAQLFFSNEAIAIEQKKNNFIFMVSLFGT